MVTDLHPQGHEKSAFKKNTIHEFRCCIMSEWCCVFVNVSRRLPELKCKCAYCEKLSWLSTLTTGSYILSTVSFLCKSDFVCCSWSRSYETTSSFNKLDDLNCIMALCYFIMSVTQNIRYRSGGLVHFHRTHAEKHFQHKALVRSAQA